MVFDTKMDFTGKSLYFATGCNSSKSYESRYAGVVKHESVHIVFTYAAINGIDIMAADTQNNYLTELCSKSY